MLPLLHRAAGAVPDTGFVTALIVALGFGVVTLTLVALHHASRLTVMRALVALGAGVSVVSAAVGGVLVVTAKPAHAATSQEGPSYVVTPSDDATMQLPTLGLE